MNIDWIHTTTPHITTPPMNTNLTFPELPADHPLNTGEGLISLHSPEVLTQPSMFIDLPYQHDKHERRGRTCRNCILSYCEQDRPGTFCEIDEQPARNTRARAVKCKSYLHFRKSLFFKALAPELAHL